jgi:membrane protease YdiL (CAAX protease family)
VLVLALTIGHRVVRVIPVDETLPILTLGWVSLRLRGTGWKGVGFAKPASWPRAIVLRIGAGVLLQVLSEFVTEPLIAHLTGQVADVSEFLPLVGNLKLLLVYLVVVWSWAAFGEELTYRGYVLNRAADLGRRTPFAWVASLLFVTTLFGVGHSYQGLAGMIDTGIHGLILGVVYLVSGRNLWAKYHRPRCRKHHRPRPGVLWVPMSAGVDGRRLTPIRPPPVK